MSRIQKQLNELVKNCTPCTLYHVSGTAALFHYEPLVAIIGEDKGWDVAERWVKEGNCYVFEIGKNCGTVFSVDSVEGIEIKETGAIIYLKGRNS